MRPVWGELTMEALVDAVGGAWVSGRKGVKPTGLSTDSRHLRPGELFWALRGERFDGHDFVGEALKAGASGVVVERPSLEGEVDERKAGRRVPVIAVPDTLRALGDLAGWWRQAHEVLVVAVTGSAGKTTTKEMAAGVIGSEHAVLKSRGNWNNLVGLPLTLIGLKERHKRAVLEMGMNHPGEIARLTQIADPQVGLITNVGKAHLQGVGSLEGVARAKAELVENMAPDAHVILNGDDPVLMETVFPERRLVTTFGTGEQNDVRADKIRTGEGGTRFELQFHGKSRRVELGIPGIHNVMNALGAAAVALRLDRSLEQVAEGLAAFTGLKGRFSLDRLPGGPVLVDDTYNANPHSLRAALESLPGLMRDKGGLIVCLGEMMELGEEAETAHREAGRQIAGLSPDYLVVAGEHAGDVLSGAVAAGMARERVFSVETHDQMTTAVRRLWTPEHLVFLKGSRKIGLEQVADALRRSGDFADC